jgi:hypothetical protein
MDLGLPNLQKVIVGIKIHWIENFCISLESFWNIDFLHDPFGFLKHKLWPKEGLGVKLQV